MKVSINRSRYLMLVGVGMLLMISGCRQQTIPPVPTAVDIPATPTQVGSRPAQPSGTRLEAGPTAIASTPGPTVPASPTPTRVPPASTATEYTVRSGDTLLRIAAAYGTTVDSLMAINGLANADQVVIGQVLKVTMAASYTGPGDILLPDSELVYGPSFQDFDVASAIADYPGYISQYTETVNGRELTGAEIVQLVAVQYGVGPRVLLALIELRGGWLSNPVPTADEIAYPLGYQVGLYWEGLYLQLCQAANGLNGGFYGWWGDTSWLVQTMDGEFIQYSADLNAGTAALQKTLADTSETYETWIEDMARFSDIYVDLWGDPFAYAVEPLISPYAAAPELELPWARGTTWYYTGGPHPGWGTVGSYAALDFVTDEENIGCMTSQRWATAIAPGVIAMSEDGMVLQDLDGDGYVGTGWVVMYMHMAAMDRVEVGTSVDTGDPIGHPSCEGGVSDASHLHLARRLNGVWIDADDARWPMTLSGWRPLSTGDAYEGTLERAGKTLTACECWEAVNAVAH